MATNQAGIARGYYTEAQFLAFSKWMRNKFIENNSHIDEIYFCPHHPIHGLGHYQKQCSCRKPAPGMFLQAQAAYDVDMKNSIMVGDNFSDLEAANLANIVDCYLFNHDQSKRIHLQKSTTHFNVQVINSFQAVNLS